MGRRSTERTVKVLADAAAKELRRQRLLKAMEQAEGAWTPENHPDLQSDEDVKRYVDRLRRSWDNLRPG